MINPLDIGSDRQLFVDDLLIDSSEGVRRRLQEPVRREIAIPGDRPWDAGNVCAGSFMEDGKGRYRAWYRCDAEPGMQLKRSGHDTAYAESADGIHWEKPNLGLFQIDGSGDNNIVWMGPGANMVPFRDGKPDIPDDERYKAIVRQGGLYALASPDGLNWHLMREDHILTDGPFDSTNVSFWDTWRGEYVAYTRGVAGVGNFKGGVRWIRRWTSSDYLKWSEPEIIDAGDTPFEHLYTNACSQYERAPGVYVMFPSRFVPERSPDPDWTYSVGVNDIVFMASRDGVRFDRSFMEGFIRPGTDFNNWHDRGIYIERGILFTAPEEMSIYGMENSHLPSMRFRRYSLRTDGFVAVNAGYGGGEFTTPPMCYSGDALELNYSTSAVGWVKVEIQDASGQVLGGFSMAAAPELYGDEIEGVYKWGDDVDLGALAGKPVRLRFALRDADLFAFRFR